MDNVFKFYCNCNCINQSNTNSDAYIREILSIEHSDHCVFINETISENLKNDTVYYNQLTLEELNQKINDIKKDKRNILDKLFQRKNHAELTLSYYGAFIYLNETLNNAISIFEKQKSPTRKPPEKQRTSYVWQNNPDKELPELYSLMIDKYKLIAPETTPEQFKAVFTGQPIDDGFEPIRWKESNRLLAYFLDSVFYGQDWQRIAGNGNLFKNKKGKTITANDLSVAKKNYIDYGNPKGYETINKILSDIKKHSEH